MRIIRRYKYAILSLVVILILVTGVVMKGHLVQANMKGDDEVSIVKSSNVTVDSNDCKKEEGKKYVEIKGAVYNPGVYPISDDARVQDVILLSGGLTDEADISVINQAKRLDDEDVIVIYTKKEVEDANKNNEVITKGDVKECVCPNPKIENDALINNDDNNDNSINKGDKGNGIVNINTATIEELMSLKGIGEAKAKAIIEYRNLNGLFKSTQDITNVSGIGESVYEKIKAYITI